MKKEMKEAAERSVSKIKLYQAVFNSPAGEAVLWDLMKVHGILSAHPADPHAMVLKEGERLVILRILSFLKMNPTKLMERIEHAQNNDE